MALTLLILAASFSAVVLMQRAFDTAAIAPVVFVMAVFLVSRSTHGYVWGIAASLISVLAVNYAFTFPYFELSFSLSENVFSGIVMLFVAAMTSGADDQPQGRRSACARRASAKRRAPICCAPFRTTCARR